MDKYRILIVEDELIIAENLSIKLKKLDYLVTDIVSSGKAAIRSVTANCPDLILMDISIKGSIDGIETAAKIKAIAEIPVIFLTAYSDDKTLERAAKVSFNGYILKPFKDEELATTIQTALQKQTAVKQKIGKQEFSKSANTDINNLVQQAKEAARSSQQKLASQSLTTQSECDFSDHEITDYLSLADLQLALKRNQLLLHYQPRVNLLTGKVVAAKARIKWQHEQFGLLDEEQFMYIAEANNLEDWLGEWLINKACKQNKIWHQSGFRSLVISVDFSGKQLEQVDLFPRLNKILFDSSLKSKFLELVISEKVLLANIKANMQRLNLIKKLGVNIALDNLGFEYSSFDYLQKLSLNLINLNRSFIRNIGQDPANELITKTVLEIAQVLNLKVVAKDVKSRSELDFLKKYKCDQVQGDVIGQYVSKEEFETMFLDDKYLLENNAGTISI